jgi:uncharacterized protein
MNPIKVISLCTATIGCLLSAAFVDPQSQEAQSKGAVTTFPTGLKDAAFSILQRQGGSIGDDNQRQSEAQTPTTLEKAKADCEAGSITSCQTAGVHYKDGMGITSDPRQARVYFERSCSGGNFQGCNDLAYLLARGDGGPVDIVRAKSLLERACLANLQMACFNSAFLLMPSDPVRAMTLYRQACESGWYGACYNLGGIYSDGLYVTRDLVLARLYYRRTCDGGVNRGCDALRVQDENARLETQNGTKSVVEIIADLERDCSNRKARACNDLGMRLFEAEGITRDWFRSADLFKRACEADSMTACFNLGAMYSQGQGVQRDLTAAAALFLRACDGDNKLSCQTLAELYLSGDGVGTSPQKATEIFERLCAQGRTLSCISLANFHESHAAGKGAAEALKWFKAALALDDANPQARLGVNRLRPGLDARQRCISRIYPESTRRLEVGGRHSALQRNVPRQGSGRTSTTTHADISPRPDTSIPAAITCGS